MSALKPFQNIPPGEFIKEELEERGWTQGDLADILGMAPKSISKIINGKQSITLDTARMLSKAFGQSPQYWINLDTNYRLRIQEKTEKITNVEIKSTIYKYMPITEMINKNWINPYKSVALLVNEVNAFWNIKDLDFKFLETEAAGLHFRKSEACRKFNIFYALTWFQKARTSVQNIKLSKYTKNRLLRICENFNTYTLEDNGVSNFIHELNNAGIVFIVLSHLQKTYIDAASFCKQNQPVIAYTARYDRIDNFWFSMAHEISHILYDLNHEDDYFIDDMDRKPANDKEQRANDFAAELLNHLKIFEFFKYKKKYISEFRVRDCADTLQIHPGIIVGALQRKKILSPRNLNKFKKSVLDQIPSEYKIEN